METKKVGPRGRRKKYQYLCTERIASFKERAGTPVNSYRAVKSDEAGSAPRELHASEITGDHRENSAIRVAWTQIRL